MSGNPFDGGEGDWLVVANAGGQYALWRPHLEVPKGWQIVYAGPDRDGALDYVQEHFTAVVGTPAT
ncbi:MbtH family NRPS accessory protein [Kitasatospora kifunensis]|uniref:MbtH protein n=1 Tax=Kitasatospora kifunensis TaxID=58351 RepID=A0A7W7QY07_KITKI|nr:MbtH family NRPS accessory protein [Kitasatospora kifunensis]MBB4921921.1 MbtH protein [Kitasatospora kifunensis]